MRPLTATIAANELLPGGLMRLTLAEPGLARARPGQSVAIRQPGALSVVALPFPLVALDGRGSAAVFYIGGEGMYTGGEGMYTGGEGMAPWLSLLPVGATLELLGPWGRPLPVDALARHAVLLGSGARLIGLLALAASLVDAGVAVVVLHDAPTATALLPPALLPAAAEYQVATNDRSAGTGGEALDLLPPLLPWADALYAALPAARYPALRDMIYRHRLRPRRGFATVLAEAPLACYAAACSGCAVPLRDGYGLLCKDGPAFDLLDIE